jgi:hypothetical protein
MEEEAAEQQRRQEAAERCAFRLVFVNCQLLFFYYLLLLVCIYIAFKDSHEDWHNFNVSVKRNCGARTRKITSSDRRRQRSNTRNTSMCSLLVRLRLFVCLFVVGVVSVLVVVVAFVVIVVVFAI